MIRLELVVESVNVPAAVVSARLGIAPTLVHVLGEARSGGPDARSRVHRWTREIDVRAFHPGGGEGISAELVALGDELAVGLHDLVDDGCEVRVVVVQSVVDAVAEPESVGILMTAEAIGWMARAGAALDLDQYLR